MQKVFKGVLSSLSIFKASRQKISLVALSIGALTFSQISPAFANISSSLIDSNVLATQEAQSGQAEQYQEFESAKITEENTQPEYVQETRRAPSAEQAIPTGNVQEQVRASYGDFEVTGDTSTLAFDESTGVLTISGGEHAISMGPGKTSTTQTIAIINSASITLAGVMIDRSTSFDSTAPITISENASYDTYILLADNSQNTLKGADNKFFQSPAIEKSGDSGSGALIIATPKETLGTGKLETIGGSSCAAIGGANSYSGANIMIAGGIIEAHGGVDAAGIGGGNGGNGRDITITGGTIEVFGGNHGSAIGGGDDGNGERINIDGGTVTAYGGEDAAGIGGGYDSSGGRSGNTISITDGVVKAYGGEDAAGIGGGANGGEGKNIIISGGSIVALGGITKLSQIVVMSGAGIGGGQNGTGSENSIGGNAVVMAASGLDTKPALEGFQDASGESFLSQGLVFTGLVTDDQTTPYTVAWNQGTVYGDTTLQNNITLPVSLKIPTQYSLTIPKDLTLTIPDGMSIQNEGTFSIEGIAQVLGTGNITTATNFYLLDQEIPYVSRYEVYQTAAGIQNYQSLPNPDTNEPFIGWYYLDSANVPKSLQEGDPVLLNQHNFYENSFHSVSTTSEGEGSIQTSTAYAIASENVDFSLIPEPGYKVEDGSVKVMAGATAVAVAEEGDLTYSFTMPASSVLISATFVADSPTPPGPIPTPDATLLPVTGDTAISPFAEMLFCLGTLAVVSAFMASVSRMLNRRSE